MAQFKPGEGGRPKGVKNKYTRKVDEAFDLAFQVLQENDATALVGWAQENLTEFYKLYARKLTTTAESTSRVLTETVSEEQARLMAEAYIESSKRRDSPVGEGEPDRLHAEVSPGLPSGAVTP